MTNEKTSDELTPQELESHHFNLDTIDLQFDAALNDAMDMVKRGRANSEYTFRDGIEDGEHLKHIRITDLSGTIIYDQDFELEDAIIRQTDTQDN